MYKLFSQRKKEEKGQVPDVYTYNKFPKAFRNQFMHILLDIFSLDKQREYRMCRGYCASQTDFWEMSCELYAREKGLKGLCDQWGYHVNEAQALEYYIDTCSDEDFLDLLDFISTEIVAKEVVKCIDKEDVEDAITELNYRLKQHSLGYEFINGRLIEKTNEQIHKEVIKPALNLLHNEKFKGAEQEYFQAFDFYKAGKNKDAILNAIKAFESVLKTICKEMKYPFDNEKDTAKQLLQHLTDNNFYPAYLESHLTGIRTTLESGAPTLRNKKAGHGQGQEIVDVADEYVEYALNLVATNIVLLVKIFNQKKGK